jgi:hypothetical protein
MTMNDGVMMSTYKYEYGTVPALVMNADEDVVFARVFSPPAASTWLVPE